MKSLTVAVLGAALLACPVEAATLLLEAPSVPRHPPGGGVPAGGSLDELLAGLGETEGWLILLASLPLVASAASRRPAVRETSS